MILLKTSVNKQVLAYGINIFLSVLFSVLITAVFIALTACLMLKGKVSAGAERIILNAIRILSCIAGGYLCGKRNKIRGFLWGLLVGALYCGILLMVRKTTGSPLPLKPVSTITSVISCLAGGMLGGMLS